jgi:hypothetical protein
MSLSQLLNDTAALLNDQNYTFISQAQLTRWVNTARRNAAKRTGCIRRLVTGQSAFGASATNDVAIPTAAQPGSLPGAYWASSYPVSASGGITIPGDFNIDYNNDYNTSYTYYPNNPPGYPTAYGAANNTCQTIPGVERYPYIGFFNNFLVRQYAGVSQIIDTIACSVNWGGTVRPNLDWFPWDEYQAYCRSYAVLNMSYPAIWSVFNDGVQGEIWLFPVPSQYNEIELDVTCLPIDLTSDF